MIRDPRVLLKAHGLWSKKHLGQNFLVDEQLPQRIAAAGGAKAQDTLFEIGAGLGTLTHALAETGNRVIALEYDQELLPILRAELFYAKNVEIRQGNVLDLDWSALAKELGPLTIYGNLPYHLSSPILGALLEHRQAWERICLLVQREFAERVAAIPGSGRRCGVLSALSSLWSYPSLLFQVPPDAFFPSPKVHSAVLILERRERPAVEVGDEQIFHQILKALFAQRRKMARKALRSFSPQAEVLLERAALDPRRRGETFNLEELGRLSVAAQRSKV